MNGSVSQGLQDLRLHRIFRALEITAGTYVELGFPAVLASNTECLRRTGAWTGVRFDGRCLKDAAENAENGCHKAWITSDNIVALLRSHHVSESVTYVSIDLDTTDLWVLRALLGGGYRPAVLSVEYNSNYPLDYWIAFPDDPAVRWDGDCFMGSSAGAVAAVATEFGYAVVDVEPGLDLFLVDRQRWGGRPVPSLSTGAVFRPFNIRRNRTGLAHARRSRQLVDYREVPPQSWFATPCHGTPGLWNAGVGLSIQASRSGGAARRFLARDLNVRTAF
ncbi:hypothetical protein EMIHUDRAFT_233985 [Emiliania huxleyi CCMP1516]|uniref:Uncharacterized protein n=2 Tax=Emiliania huxleyi TaxID=2903 RepID=A0A0D3K139_EMIH1|nr:hypothetical protein EMIHUDRAFT_233985 [Emiliania huxleyi CCMP1516]EOD29474.1 hypothetical protein EMIHUDRAFT_233985 [Emiliania huxleyi CCMP1516]|eukprot:XP_005781903.1 hypothetical protein EMIHUDRAFT_233985 [Emiliania huxleyi CCMP1516]